MLNRPGSSLRALRHGMVALALLLVPQLALGQAPPAAAKKIEPTTKPFLWRIEGDTPSYLYGTIHLPDDRVLALPAVVTEAIDSADELYCELAMEPELQMAMMGAVMLPQGQTLKDVLPKATYDRTAAFLASKGLGIEAFAGMKPWVVMTQLSTLDYLQEMMTKQALDVVVYNRAKAAGKKVGGLEKPEEQTGAFDAFSNDEMAKMIDQTIEQMEKGAKEGVHPTEKLLLAYLSGEDAELSAQAEESMGDDDALSEKLTEALVNKRNRTMVERIQQKLKESPDKTFFFAVGAMHYPGEQGVLKLLENAGLKLDRLTAEDAGSLVPEAAGAAK